LLISFYFLHLFLAIRNRNRNGGNRYRVAHN